MGEIAEALRRARKERPSPGVGQRPAPAPERPLRTVGPVFEAPEPVAAPEIQQPPPPERVVAALMEGA